jgi:hypothetical protein
VSGKEWPTKRQQNAKLTSQLPLYKTKALVKGLLTEPNTKETIFIAKGV